MAQCSSCKQEIQCPEHEGFNHAPLGPVLPCAQMCSIWVRAVEEGGKSVPGITAAAHTKNDKTKSSGFAKLENLPEGKHAVELGLDGAAVKDYQPLDSTSRTEKLAKGDLKLITVVLKPRVKPLLNLSAPAVAVGGKTASLTLSTDVAYDGAGTFTCKAGAEKLKFTPSLDGNKIQFDAFAGPQTITVEAKEESSALGEIEFEWALDPNKQKGEAATEKMTVVKAELKVYKKSGTELSKSEKSGDGRTVHLQKPGKKWTRAKTEVVVTPAGYKGNILLALAKPTVELYDKADGGSAVDLSAKIEVGPGKKLEYFVGGIKVSANKADTALELKIDELSDTVDSCKFTVVQVTLEICAPRVDADTDPAAMAGDQKLAVGRKLFKQRTKLTGQRALLRVTKEPLDAPCKLKVLASAGGDKIAYYEATGEKTRTDMTTSLPVTGKHSNENPVDGVAGKAFPRDIKVDEVKDLTAASHKKEDKHLYQGLVFWLEGIAVSTERETKLQLDAEDVDELCDAVACTVAQPKLNIELIWKDPQPATTAQDVDFKLTAPGDDTALKTGQIKYATHKASLDVDAGYYGIAVTPHTTEKERRIMRTVPADSETSLAVFADTTVKFELLPPYESIQCIGYFMRTGAYLGVDNVVTGATSADDLRSKKRIQALNDIDGRCAIMKDAVVKAYTATGVKASDEKVLKIFMAPEFYFRGKQGAYPLATMPEILTPPTTPVKTNIQALKTELDNAKYKDWLFVLGSAIGAIELDTDPQRTEVSGDITLIEPKVSCDVWVKTSGPANGVTAGWRMYWKKSGSSVAVTGSASVAVDGGNTRYRLELANDIDFDADEPVALGQYGLATVTYVTKQAIIDITSGTAPMLGWFIEQGGDQSTIIDGSASGGTSYGLRMEVPIDGRLVAGAADLIDNLSNTYPINIDSITSSAVIVDHTTGSAADNAAADWRFWNEPVGPPFPVKGNASFVVSSVGPISATRKAIVFADVIPLQSTDKLAVGDLYPANRIVSEKLVTIEVQFTAPATIAKGQFFEMGGEARGLVESTTDLGGNKLRLLIWMPLEKPRGLTVGDNVTFSTPGNAEILNVALVRKGGSGTPVRADGGAQKELLVYKETISSVDFEGMDYSEGRFYRTDRQAIKLFGEPARKAKPTVGASDSSSPNVSGALTPSGKRITEVNRSGLGGGSIFTMDGITFGLEVCLDHGEKKLVAYYQGLPSSGIVAAAQPGEPKIQVQLIPSCGMGIKDDAKCTVADGIIFNVDAYKYACQKDGGGAAAAEKGDLLLTPPSASTYFKTNEKAKTGYIKVFEVLPKPTKELV